MQNNPSVLEEWYPIDSAPKDGRILWLTAFDHPENPITEEQFEVHAMQWMGVQKNGLFPGQVGMWTHPSGAYTWNGEPGDGGPTHWRFA